MFEKRGKLSSVKEKVIRIVSVGKEDSNVFSANPVSRVSTQEAANSLTNYSLEADFKKAQVQMYQRMFDILR